MNTSANCPSCGTTVPAGSAFCGRCGQAIRSDPSLSASTGTEEPTLGIIPALGRRKGFLGLSTDTFNLIITPRRLIFALVAPKMMREAIATARDEAKAGGSGFFGQWAAQMAWVEVVCRAYGAMPIDTILTEFPGSFELANASITRVRLEEPDDDEDSASTANGLTIEAGRTKHRFTFSSISCAEATDLLRATLPNLVR